MGVRARNSTYSSADVGAHAGERGVPIFYETSHHFGGYVTKFVETLQTTLCKQPERREGAQPSGRGVRGQRARGEDRRVAPATTTATGITRTTTKTATGITTTTTTIRGGRARPVR